VYRPPGGPGVRNDSGVYSGAEVSVHYDPLISKLITWGRDRPEAIGRMRRALREFVIKGIKTSIPFHRAVMEHPQFLAGHYDTSFIDTHIMPSGATSVGVDEEELRAGVMLAAIAALKRDQELAKRASQGGGGGAGGSGSRWKQAGRERQLRGGR
jgi:acetyl-CoA carboxylase biotin carboxylase subunit